jgi:hypothetical protein
MIQDHSFTSKQMLKGRGLQPLTTTTSYKAKLFSPEASNSHRKSSLQDYEELHTAIEANHKLDLNNRN